MSAHVTGVLASLPHLLAEHRMRAILAEELAPGKLVLALCAYKKSAKVQHGAFVASEPASLTVGVHAPGAGPPAHRREPRLVAPLGVHPAPDHCVDARCKVTRSCCKGSKTCLLS